MTDHPSSATQKLTGLVIDGWKSLTILASAGNSVILSGPRHLYKPQTTEAFLKTSRGGSQFSIYRTSTVLVVHEEALCSCFSFLGEG
jgi:hypothetical protein